ncbi:phage tail terminator-like protein [Methylobacterium sp. ID0610]|uniref:phage tail terminator-like protein n=1 Tax=Methylobacterium carpenticola TaxID=3344827 RepID=UPI003693DA8D
MAATSPEARILDALLTALTGLALDPPLPLALPGIGYSPVTGKPYLAASYLPNTSRLDGLAFDGDRTHIGLFVVTVVWSAGGGLVKPLDVAARVRRAFAAGTRLEGDPVTVCIDESPEVGAPLDDGPWLRVPVTIRWRVGVSAAA